MDLTSILQAILTQGNMLNAVLLYMWWRTDTKLWTVIAEARKEREEATQRLVSVTEALKSLNREASSQ